MSKAKDTRSRLRDLADAELRENLDRTRDELFRIQLGMHTNQVASTAELRSKRREVALILTILRARELELETQGAGKGA
jgi:ribosomal protein L29